MLNILGIPQLSSVIEIIVSSSFRNDLIVAIVGSLIGGGFTFAVAAFTSKQESNKMRDRIKKEKEETLNLERTLYLEKMELDDLLKLRNELDYSIELILGIHKEVINRKKIDRNFSVNIIGALSSSGTNMDTFMNQYFPGDAEQKIFSDYLKKIAEFEKYLFNSPQEISNEKIEEDNRTLVEKNNDLVSIVSNKRYRKFKEMQNKTNEIN